MSRLRLIAAALLLVVAARMPALETVLHNRSWLGLSGRTNAGPWQCATHVIRVNLAISLNRAAFDQVVDRLDAAAGNKSFAAFAPFGDTGAGAPPVLLMAIPIDRIDCGNGKMERDLRKALKAKAHPTIFFELRKITPAAVSRAGNYSLALVGNLRIAGVVKSEECVLLVERLPDDEYRVTTEMALRMSDFGVTPPTGLFGLIKAEDGLLIRFHLIFALIPEPGPLAVQRRNPVTPDPASLVLGQRLFKDNCAACHGKLGRGDGVAASGLDYDPSDLTAARVQKRSDGSLFWTLAEGRKPMSGFTRKLTDTERWHLINQLRALAAAAAPASAPAPAQ